jgi:hypothetical protein
LKSAKEYIEKSEPSHTGDGNIKWCSHLGKGWQFLKKLNLHISHDPVIPLFGIHSRNEKHVFLYMNVHKNIIHNSEKEETTQMSTNINKQNVAYTNDI